MTDMETGGRRGAAGNRRRKAGETLTETLITVLIVGLSSVLFLTMVGASGRIFRRAEEMYETMYKEITAADEQDEALSPAESDGIGKIVVSGSSDVPVEVNWYRYEDGDGDGENDKDYVLSYLVR